MPYIADLHIHSHYSRATAKTADAPHLALAAKEKGIHILGSGDCCHPAYRRELHEQLMPAEEGFYILKEEFRLPGRVSAPEPRFVLTTEISCIYKKAGKTRKVHSLILLPSLAAAEALSLRLEKIGNIRSDGRPILGLDAKDLLSITLEASPEALFIPAHIWTPHFSLFGAFSGFDRLEDCFEDLSGEIHALETGLSSDPLMNARLSVLDGYTLVSNSDAHSPEKLGREANLLSCSLSYASMKRAIETGDGFAGTLEFFPEEGKYHFDGHRNCGVCLSPEETKALQGLCPVCGKRLTLGVEHRIEALADRPFSYVPENPRPFESLMPLMELLGESEGLSPTSKKVHALYQSLLDGLGSEFHILREADPSRVEKIAGPLAAEGLRRMRRGQVERIPGYDGEFGTIRLFKAFERQAILGQTGLFPALLPDTKTEKKTKKAKEAPEKVPDTPILFPPNPEQEAAIHSPKPYLSVIAGPGTGKTRCLVGRIAHLLERGVKPSSITSLSFTRLAAGELKERLERELGKKAVRGLHTGTFHSIALELLPPKPILNRQEALSLMEKSLFESAFSLSPREALEALSQWKNDILPEEKCFLLPLFQVYEARKQQAGFRDLDDILLEALALPVKGQKRFSQLLVDEFQDTNGLQRKLLCHWAEEGEGLFVIGDPDQSIYGFRGAAATGFQTLLADFPQMEVLRLVKNYRSSPAILSAALSLIDHNPGGERKLEALSPAADMPRLFVGENIYQEAEHIASRIESLTGGTDMHTSDSRKDAFAFSDMAVLSRNHRQLEILENCLLKRGIPCEVSGRGSYLEAEGTAKALAFFRSLLTEKERLSPGIREEFLPLLTEAPARLLERYALRFGEFEGLSSLKSLAASFINMEDLLRAIAIGEEADLKRQSALPYASGAVKLMTLHGSKGLEFPVVFLAGLSQGLLPLVHKDESVDVEEERRLLYVGLTRAKSLLFLSCARPESPFLSELPEMLIREEARPRLRIEQLKLF